MQFDNR